MPELDATDIAVALAKLEGRTETLETQLRQIDRMVGELRDLAAQARGGWVAIGIAASAGAGLTGLLGPLFRKLGL